MSPWWYCPPSPLTPVNCEGPSCPSGGPMMSEGSSLWRPHNGISDLGCSPKISRRSHFVPSRKHHCQAAVTFLLAFALPFCSLRWVGQVLMVDERPVLKRHRAGKKFCKASAQTQRGLLNGVHRGFCIIFSSIYPPRQGGLPNDFRAYWSMQSSNKGYVF